VVAYFKLTVALVKEMVDGLQVEYTKIQQQVLEFLEKEMQEAMVLTEFTMAETQAVVVEAVLQVQVLTVAQEQLLIPLGHQ
jgi:hypothetical protein